MRKHSFLRSSMLNGISNSKLANGEGFWNTVVIGRFCFTNLSSRGGVGWGGGGYVNSTKKISTKKIARKEVRNII